MIIVNKTTLRSQRGSAMLQAILAVGVMALLAYGAVQVTSQIQASTQAWGFTPRLNTLSNMVLGMVSTPALCRANFNLAAPYVDAVGAQTPVQLRLPLFGGGTPLVIPSGVANINIPELAVTVHRVDFIQSRPFNPATDLNATTGNKTYEGVLQILAYGRGNSSVVSRKQVAKMNIIVNSANNFVGCQSEVLAADVCTSMGGVHHPELTPSCRFPYPDGDCTAAGPGYFIKGINADGTLDCQYQAIRCPTNQVLVGFVITAGVPVPSCKNLNLGGPPPPPTPPVTCSTVGWEKSAALPAAGGLADTFKVEQSFSLPSGVGAQFTVACSALGGSVSGTTCTVPPSSQTLPYTPNPAWCSVEADTGLTISGYLDAAQTVGELNRCVCNPANPACAAGENTYTSSAACTASGDTGCRSAGYSWCGTTAAPPPPAPPPPPPACTFDSNWASGMCMGGIPTGYYMTNAGGPGFSRTDCANFCDSQPAAKMCNYDNVTGLCWATNYITTPSACGGSGDVAVCP